MFYNRVLERLIEHSRSLPPNLILHEFAINAVHITEQVKQFQPFGLIFCIRRFLLGGQIIHPSSGEDFVPTSNCLLYVAFDGLD